RDNIQPALSLELGRRGVDDALAIPVADTHRADRVLERYVGQEQRRGGADDRKSVGVVLPVGREQQADHLRVARPALREEGAQRAVDHAGGEDLLLVRAALALEEAPGDLAGGIRVLTGSEERG